MLIEFDLEYGWLCVEYFLWVCKGIVIYKDFNKNYYKFVKYNRWKKVRKVRLFYWFF